MTAPALLVLSFVGVLATGDWIAVLRQNRRLEYLFKPLTTLALIGVALALEPADDAIRAWFVVALAFSLLGDVFLMLPRDLFIAGLGAFLLAHLAYIAGMSLDDLAPERIGAGTLVAVVVLGLIGTRIAAGARRRSPQMLGPVVLYMLVIAAMLVTAVATGRPAAIVGAGFFVASDALIGWTRFVRPDLLEPRQGQPGRAPLAIMVTYHIGQAGLVLSLASHGQWALLGLVVVMVIVLFSLLELI